jgi:hypothetical protein
MATRRRQRRPGPFMRAQTLASARRSRGSIQRDGRGSALAGADPMARGALVGATALQVRETRSRDRSNVAPAPAPAPCNIRPEELPWPGQHPALLPATPALAPWPCGEHQSNVDMVAHQCSLDALAQASERQRRQPAAGGVVAAFRVERDGNRKLSTTPLIAAPAAVRAPERWASRARPGRGRHPAARGQWRARRNRRRRSA